MRPHDIALLRVPGRPTISPDGQTAVVAVRRPDLTANAYRSELWTVPTDASGPARRLTRGPKDSAPRFSPDGAWLAFLRDVDGHDQLHVLPVAGGDAVRVSDHPLGAGAPQWGPDSTRLAYSARVPEPGRYGTDDDLPADKEAPRLITELAYRVDGTGYTRDRRRHLFVVEVLRAGDPVDEATPLQVTDGDWDDTDPAWSPDGALLVFVSARHDRREQDLAADVFVCAADGTDVRRLTGSTSDVSRPAFTPDGATVVFTGSSDLGSTGSDFVANHDGLWTVPLEGGTPTRLTDAEADDLSDGMPLTMTAEGALVGRLHRGAIELWRRPWDGDPAEAVLTGPRQVHGHDAAAGVVVATVTDWTNAGELVAVRDGVETALTDFGAGVTAAGLRAPEEVTATAPDGYPVHGWIVRPEGPGPFPVLLNVHGGPYAQYGWTLFDEAQVYATAGYAVVMGNPRGAAGYGQAHGRVIKDGFGTVDADDVLALLDQAVTAPDLDGERVGVMGGSYGGFMTTWLVGHTERFAAAISERAFNEPVSFVGSSDIGWFFGLQYLGQDPARVADQSPFSFLDKINTPTMVIHSEQDWRCPVEQGQRLFTHLKLRGVETELLLFPGEGHELSRSGLPSHRVARFEHILRWWARHLPTEANQPG